MGTSSEAFRLIETGGDPRRRPALDYTLFLPLILSRYSLDLVPFLIRYPQTSTVIRYLDLDYKLIQRQVKEELQLEKQNINSGKQQSGLFESGSPEDRARIVLVELQKLQDQWDRPDQDTIQTTTLVLSNPIYRQEVSLLLSTLSLRCRHPMLDIQRVVRALLSVREPGTLVTSLIANHPAEFSAVIDSLLDSDLHGNSRNIISRLCKLSDHQNWNIRQQLVERKMFPNLAIELTIEHCHDEICFMNRILRAQPDWLTAVDPITRSSLTSIMEFIFSSLNDEMTSSRPDHVAIYRLLRILSGMIGLLSLSLSAEQLEISLLVLEMAQEPSTVDIKVCLILMSAAQLLKYSESRVERILHELLKCKNSPQVLLLSIHFRTDQLLRIDDFASRVLSMDVVIPRGGLMELKTLFSTLFTDEELSKCALGLGRPLSSEASQSFGAAGFGPSQEAFDLRTVSNLCVYHLLKENVFQKSGIDVRTWVLEQILDSKSVPLDVNMVPLLRAYTTAISQSDAITRIPESDIKAHFNNPCEDLTPAKVLLVLYMLLNNDVCLSNLNSEHIGRNSEYAATLLERIQVRKVLLFVQNHQGGLAFKTVQPMFLKLVHAQFPEMFNVTTLLLEEGLANATSTLAVSSVVSKEAVVVNGQPSEVNERTQFMEAYSKAFRQHLEDPDSAVKAYHLFQRLPQAEQQRQAEAIIEASLPLLLDHRSNPTVMEAFKNTWDRLNSLMPHDLWAMTVHALLPRPHAPVVSSAPQGTSASVNPAAAVTNSVGPLSFSPQSGQKSKQGVGVGALGDYYTFEWLVQDPLLLFKVDFRVFRSPVIFRLFIQILGAVMVGSRHWFRKQFHASQAAAAAAAMQGPLAGAGGLAGGLPKAKQFKETNLSAMLYIQDSTLIQLLLEVCQSRAEDGEVEAETVKGVRVGGEQQQQEDVRMGRDDGEGRVLGGMVTATTDTTSAARQGNDALKEVRVVAFNFLHQLFIDHKIFPKLVHFQGYSMDLLPITVKGIDSIHVCLDFLQELLASSAPAPLGSVSALSSLGAQSAATAAAGTGAPLSAGGNANVAGGPGAALPSASVGVGADEAHELFGLQLAAQLCERFPLPNTMQMTVDFILPKMKALAVSTGFAKEVLSSARVLCKAFPTLQEDIVRMLREASSPQDKVELQRTIDAIDADLTDPAIWDKSLS